MRGASQRVMAVSAAYVTATTILFFVFRAWKGGSIWSDAILHNMRVVSSAHHFFPPWTVVYVTVGVVALIATAIAVALIGRRAITAVMVFWSGLFAVAGTLLAAVEHLRVLATEPNMPSLGHTTPHGAATLVFLGFVLALRAGAPDVVRFNQSVS